MYIVSIEIDFKFKFNIKIKDINNFLVYKKYNEVNKFLIRC